MCVADVLLASVAASGRCRIRPHTATPGASRQPWYVRRARARVLGVFSHIQGIPAVQGRANSLSAAAFFHTILRLDLLATPSSVPHPLRVCARRIRVMRRRGIDAGLSWKAGAVRAYGVE